MFFRAEIAGISTFSRRTFCATGRGIPDAALASLAIENGAILATLDGGFGRFPRLTWMDPLDGAVRKNPARSASQP